MTKRFYFFIITLLVVCSTAFAQKSAADKFYTQGVACMKAMTIASQQKAIGFFSKAKVAYDSQAKKSLCDNQISVCRNIISNLKSGKQPTSKTNRQKNHGKTDRKTGQKKNDLNERPTVSDDGITLKSESTTPKPVTADGIIDKYLKKLGISDKDMKPLVQLKCKTTSHVVDKKGKQVTITIYTVFDSWKKQGVKLHLSNKKKFRRGLLYNNGECKMYIDAGGIYAPIFGRWFNVKKIASKEIMDKFKELDSNNIFDSTQWKRSYENIQEYNGKRYHRITLTNKKNNTPKYIALFDTETDMLKFLDNGNQQIEMLEFGNVNGRYMCKKRKVTNNAKIADKTDIRTSEETIEEFCTECGIKEELMDTDKLTDIIKGKSPIPW